MYFKDDSKPGNSSVWISLNSEWWVKITTAFSEDKELLNIFIYLYKGEKKEGAIAKSMFTLEPLQGNLYMLAYGLAGEAVFDSFGTYRECLEKAFASFKNTAQVL